MIVSYLPKIDPSIDSKPCSLTSLHKSMALKITKTSSLQCQLAVLVTESDLHHTRSILCTSSSCLLYFSSIFAWFLTVWLELRNLLFQLCDLVAVHYMRICQLSGERETKLACFFSCFLLTVIHVYLHICPTELACCYICPCKRVDSLSTDM